MRRVFSTSFFMFFSLAFCLLNIYAQDKTTKISGGVLNGKAINLVKPEIPSAAKAVNASGQVLVQIAIDENGSVFEAKAVSGHALLRKASEDAALKTGFKPTMLSGKPVQVLGILIYNFGNSSSKESSDTFMTTPKVIAGGILNGKAISLPKPELSASAKAVNASGIVNVQITIDEKGSVINASAFSGHALLRTSAEKAALEAKFEPTYLSGKAIKVSGVLVYNFNSSASSTNLDSNTVSLGVLNSKAKNLEKPVYPSAAKAVKAEGSVQIFVLIDESGNVIEAKATSGHALLRESSEKAAKNSTFEPFIVNGKAVKTTGTIVYNFFEALNKVN